MFHACCVVMLGSRSRTLNDDDDDDHVSDVRR